jgi:trehalose 6-phosphate synthase/phosphatase
MKVVIITGRSRKSIGYLLDNINIDVVAEHGAIIRESGKWQVIKNEESDWKVHLFPVLNKYSQLLPGTFPEEKEFSLAWHYRNIPPNVGRIYSKALTEELSGFSSLYNLRIIDGKKVVEIMSNEINKGTAVEYLTRKSAFDYILSIGDDKTDEDMFNALSGKINADTVKIGKGRSVAMYNLNDVRQVRVLLRHLLNEMAKRLN